MLKLKHFDATCMDVLRFMWTGCYKSSRITQGSRRDCSIEYPCLASGSCSSCPSAYVVFRAHILKLGCKHMDMMDFKAGELSMWSQWSSRIDLVREGETTRCIDLWFINGKTSKVLSDRATETLKGGSGFLNKWTSSKRGIPGENLLKLKHRKGGIYWVVPLPSNSDHQDYFR